MHSISDGKNTVTTENIEDAVILMTALRPRDRHFKAHSNRLRKQLESAAKEEACRHWRSSVGKIFAINVATVSEQDPTSVLKIAKKSISDRRQKGAKKRANELKTQIEKLNAEKQSTRESHLAYVKENSELKNQIKQWERFASELGERYGAGTLSKPEHLMNLKIPDAKVVEKISNDNARKIGEKAIERSLLWLQSYLATKPEHKDLIPVLLDGCRRLA